MILMSVFTQTERMHLKHTTDAIMQQLIDWDIMMVFSAVRCGVAAAAIRWSVLTRVANQTDKIAQKCWRRDAAALNDAASRVAAVLI